MAGRRTRRSAVEEEPEEEPEEAEEEEEEDGEANGDEEMEEEEDSDRGDEEEEEEGEEEDEDQSGSSSESGDEDDGDEEDGEEEGEDDEQAEDEDENGEESQNGEDEVEDELQEAKGRRRTRHSQQKPAADLNKKKTQSGGGAMTRRRSSNSSSNHHHHHTLDNTSQMPSHGMMTAASTTNTPATVIPHPHHHHHHHHQQGSTNGNNNDKSTGGRPTRKRRSGTPKSFDQQLDQSDDDDQRSTSRKGADEDEDESAQFAVSTIATSAGAGGVSAEQDKRPFKHLDPSAAIPLRVSKTKKIPVEEEVIAKKYSIPAPPTTAASIAFEKLLPGPYVPTLAYVRFKPEFIRPHDYEMTMEDENWLKSKASTTMKQVTPDIFEKLITAFEVSSGMGGTIPSAKAAPVGQKLVDPNLPKAVCEEVHAYWISKRNRNRRPLLRRFWPITPAEDTTPTLTFRPREKERYRLRKKRMNDMESYEKLCYLKKDFERVRDMLELVKRREDMKRLEVELIHCEYLERLNPSNVRPSCLDTPLATLLEEPEPLELAPSAESLYNRGRYRAAIASASANMPSAGGLDLASTSHKKSTKRKKGVETGEEEEEEEYVGGRAAGGAFPGAPPPVAASSAASQRAAAAAQHEVLLAGVPEIVPVPRFLLEDTEARHLISARDMICQQAFPPVPAPDEMDDAERSRKTKKPKTLKVQLLARLGRNRRVLFDRFPVLSSPQPQRLLSPRVFVEKRVDPLVLPPSALQRMEALLADDRDTEEEVVEPLDMAIFALPNMATAPGKERPMPKFQLMV